MLHALKKRLTVNVKESDSRSCVDIKYFTSHKSAVLNLLNKIMSDK